jgi:hypothetical protein
MSRSVVFALLTCVAACQSEAASATAEATAAIEAEVAGLAEGIMDAAMTWDEARTWELLASSPFFTSEGVSLPLEQSRAEWRTAAATSSRQSLVDRSTRVQVLSSDVAVSTMTGTYSSFDKAGVESPKVPYAWTAVWQRQNDRWVVVAGHQSVQGGWPDQGAAVVP